MTNEQLAMLLYGLRYELDMAIEETRGKLLEELPDGADDELWPLELFVKNLSERIDLLRPPPR